MIAFILEMHSPIPESNGTWGPFKTRGVADWFAKHHLGGSGTWVITELRNPRSVLVSENELQG